MQPRLIHPVLIVIERYKREESRQSHRAREPIRGGKKFERSVTVQAQVDWRNTDGFSSQEPTGARLESDGHFTFRIRDLNKIGFRPVFGDKVVKVGKEIVELYITGGELAGHYPDQGGPTLYVAPFSTRVVQ